MKRLMLLWCVCLACGCSSSKNRPCLERAECFAGEYCSERGICQPYKGKTTTKARPKDDLGQPELFDMSYDLADQSDQSGDMRTD